MRLRKRKQRFKLRPTSLPGSVFLFLFLFFFHLRGEVLGTNLGARAASSLQQCPRGVYQNKN